MQSEMGMGPSSPSTLSLWLGTYCPALVVLAVLIHHIIWSDQPVYLAEDEARLPDWRFIFRKYINSDHVRELEEEEHREQMVDASAGVLSSEPQTRRRVRPPMAVTIGLTIIGLTEAFVWIAYLAYSLLVGRSHRGGDVPLATLSILVWAYAALCPIFRPTTSPPYDLLAIYCLRTAPLFETIYKLFRERIVYHNHIPTLEATTTLGNLAVYFVAISLILSMPLHSDNLPSARVETDYPQPPEEQTTLFGWLTFRWVNVLIKKGLAATLEDKDVYAAPSDVKSRILLKRFHEVTPVESAGASDSPDRQGNSHGDRTATTTPTPQKITLLRRVLRANAQDLTLDFIFALVSAVLAYAGPFFLKQILDAIESSTRGDSNGTTKETAFQYAFFAFFLSVLKSQIDLQRLVISRRASVRIRAELVMLLYDKSLRRKDFRGTLAAPTPVGDGDKGKSDDKKQDPPAKAAAADVGKIVSLMAVDAQRVGMAAAAMNMLYAAPLEVIVASAFLFKLLGPSALVGYMCMFISTPLQTYLAKSSMRLYRSMSEARDKRMSVLSEVITGLKFLKYFGTIGMWSERVLEARETELRWNLKGAINRTYFMVIMTLTPAIFATACFTSYTVVFGHELDAATGFTAIALFGMVRGPLNILPGFITQLLNTHVCLKRIERFLEEDEVPSWVCSARNDVHPPTPETFDRRILCKDATFRWADAQAVSSDQKSPLPPTSSLLAKAAQKLRLVKSPQSGPPALTATTEERGADADANKSFELRDITISPPVGKMTLIAGPTGCGKSTLLASLLGEVSLVSGSLQLPKHPFSIDSETGMLGTIAYCAQQPWLQQASIKDNILFGSAFNEGRYQAVLECCALNPDLAILTDGDLTEIGERGITLSGGQKARVALARAVYSSSATVLMDDVLAAVDSHTAEKITRECFAGPLMQGRTVLLVTHHINLVLPGCAWVILLDDGRVTAEGPVDKLRENGTLEAVATIVKEEMQEEAAEQQDSKDNAELAAEQVTNGKTESADDKPAQPAAKLVQDEQKATGAVKLSVYDLWLQAASYWTVLLVLVLLMLFKVNDLAEKLWLSFWTSSYEHTRSVATDGGEVPLYAQWGFPPANEHVWPYIVGFILIQSMSAVVLVVVNIFSYLAVIRAGRKLFARMLNAVVRSTSRWLDQSPSGRITSRFAVDIDKVDGSLQNSLQQAVSSLVNLAFSLGAISFVVPGFALVACCIAVIYYQLAKGYVACGRDLRRIESVTRSPIFSSFGELLDGITTVRAYSQETRFLTITEKRLDRTSSAHWYTWMTSRWLLVRFDCISAVCVLAVTVLALSGGIPAGLAGIAVTQALALTTSIYWLCRNYADLEMDGNSLERISELINTTPQEAPAIVEDARPPALWPSEGGIDITDLEIRYSPELPAVLHGISLSIRPREKIGVVGRTGSGKSTLALAFFRFVEFSRGSITIDGIDVSKMGLDDLRSRLVIIPQDAVLFSGTIRDNLDPFNEHSDEDCLHVLRQVQLYSTPLSSRLVSRRDSLVEGAEGSAASGALLAPTAEEGTGETTAVASGTATPRPQQSYLTLDTVVADAGGNFSAGQRQLLAVARAMLRKSRVVICDEMSSAIDFHTDTILQRTMSEAFEDSTVLTIAHRLSTVASTSDRVLVLDRGNVVEFDSPHTLLSDEGSVFYGMCKKSGELETLKKAAEDVALKRAK